MSLPFKWRSEATTLKYKLPKWQIQGKPYWEEEEMKSCSKGMRFQLCKMNEFQTSAVQHCARVNTALYTESFPPPPSPLSTNVFAFMILTIFIKKRIFIYLFG